MKIPNPFELDPVIGIAVPFFFLFVLVEYWVRDRQQIGAYDKKDAWASIGMGAGSAVINLLTKTTAFLVYSWLYQFRFFDLGSAWWVWILLFFADDLTFYLHHRSCHEVRVFWAAHVNHHSSRQYNLAVALRQSWGELFHKYIWWIWLPIMGCHPLMILTMMTISLIYQFFLHTETVRRFPGIIEFIFNTPSHHRVHHAKNVRYLDRNHAGMLIIWDRLFGTFEPEREEESVVYGITNDIDTYNPFEIASHEYRKMISDVRKAPGLKAKLGYIFMPPGWSHDGSTLTADQMRQQNL
jgi:sterol desaturase/sphingolipid hydroxylase (fatty acid hydroxylase superfamily)